MDILEFLWQGVRKEVWQDVWRGETRCGRVCGEVKQGVWRGETGCVER